MSMEPRPSKMALQPGARARDTHGYVVLAQDPTKPTGTGAVLGALELSPLLQGSNSVDYGEATLVLSPMRKELVYDAFGLGKWVGAAPPHAGERDSAGSPSFCVDGVSRDTFVPLQNDLTDNSSSYENSWQHYLSLAQEAATNADSLGQQMVDIGFQGDVNIENAAEQLLQQTGSLPDVNSISVDSNGIIQAGGSNGALAAILSQPTLDVVFFGPGPNTTDPTAMKSALGCTQNPQNPLCAKLSSAGIAVQPVSTTTIASWTGPSAGNTFTYAALNLPGTSPPQQGALTCAPLVTGAAAMKGIAPGGAYSPTTAFNALPFAGAASALDANAIASTWANGAITMSISDQPTVGHWAVTFKGQPLMDSDAQAQWPACLGAPTGAPTPAVSCNFAGNPLTAAFNDMFRWCPGLDARNSALGACEGNSADAELNAIRWRIESALWLGAAMSGGIPAGTFSGPMPAANFQATDPTTVSAPVNTIFGNGSFVTGTLGTPVTAFATIYRTVSTNELSTLSQGGAVVSVDPGSRYFHWGPNGSQQVPLWLASIYAPAYAKARAAGGLLPFNTGDAPATAGGPPYVHVFASNVSGPSDFGGVRAFFAGSPLSLTGLSSQVTPQMWGAIVNLLGNQQCQSPLGNGAFGYTSQLGSTWLQGLVASLKTEQSLQSDMRAPFADFFIGENSEWATSYAWGQGAFQYNWLDAVQIGTTLPATWFDQVAVRYHVAGTGIQVLPQDVDFVSAYAADYTFPFGYPQRNPSVIAPAQRLPFALNSGAPNGNCDAAWQLTQAMAFSCLAAFDLSQSVSPPSSATDPLTAPPATYQDVATLTSWLKGRVAASAQALGNAYVAHVPAVVVSNALNVPGTLTSSAGAVGKDLAQTSNALLNVYSDWRNVQMDAQSIANALESTRIAIEQANATAAQAQINAQISRLGAMKAIADDTAQGVAGIGSIVAGVIDIGASAGTAGLTLASGVSSLTSGAASAMASGQALQFDQALLPLIAQLQATNGALLTDNINAAIANLNQQVNIAGTAMANGMTSLRQDANNVSAGTGALATDRASTSYYAGKAAGANVWQCTGNSGQAIECASHVNTVLNRRYDGTEIRYKAALTNAKAMAYLARLAIEQRLGIRLNDISTPVGTLPAPSTWADDVCHLTGINYQNLRTEIGLDAGTTQSQAANQLLASQFADGFIGDYVQKLTDFVAFYNVANPEQDGNDTAVLSLRETLLGGNSACAVPSSNLLVDSSRLYAPRPGVSQSAGGWTVSTCAPGDATCLQPRSVGSMQLPTVPGGVTWLSDQPRSSATVDAGAGDAGSSDGGKDGSAEGGAADAGVDGGPVDGGTAAEGGTPSPGPDDVETQQVLLNAPGTYILSWWDQALDPVTGKPSMTAVPYQVGIYDSAWRPVGGFAGPPQPSSDMTGAGWSSRRAVTFAVLTPDVYHVVFGASVSNSAPGSVAVANVQLELANSSRSATPYVDTNSSGQMVSFSCGLTPSALRAQFQRNCDPDGTCHYDLATPFTVNTQTMTSNGQPLAGKFATGNFNFRHIDVAVNVVGTGVIDCTSSGSPDCYGSGFLQYTLIDNGSDVGVLGADGQYRSFDFGTATISRAKALTAERYITTPLGSADQQLVDQGLQVQFRGRPVDGVYGLKIYDTPALHFDKIQDVQIVLNYHYWSSVVTTNNAN